MPRLSRTREAISQRMGGEESRRDVPYVPDEALTREHFSIEEIEAVQENHSFFVAFAALGVYGEPVVIPRKLLQALVEGVIDAKLQYDEVEEGGDIVARVYFEVQEDEEKKYSVADVMMGGEGGPMRFRLSEQQKRELTALTRKMRGLPERGR